MTREEPINQLTRDRMHSALAMTHHIQTRILQVMEKGRVSAGVAIEVRKIAEAVSASFKEAAE